MSLVCSFNVGKTLSFAERLTKRANGTHHKHNVKYAKTYKETKLKNHLKIKIEGFLPQRMSDMSLKNIEMPNND